MEHEVNLGFNILISEISFNIRAFLIWTCVHLNLYAMLHTFI